jgi:hypothetical protein
MPKNADGPSRRRPNRRTLLRNVSAFLVGQPEGAQVSGRSRVRPGKVGARAAAVLLACIGIALALGVALALRFHTRDKYCHDGGIAFAR